MLESTKNYTLENLVTPHFTTITRYIWYPTIGCMVIRIWLDMMVLPTKQAMMLVNGVNPIASSKIDGIYNIEDIAGTKFEMQLKILTSTGADLYLNGLKSTNFNPQKEEIYGKEELSWYLFDNNDLENILPLGPDKRLTIESNGPLYGQYYGYNTVQGLAGYFFLL